MDQDHVPAPSDEKQDFDDDTLRAIAEVYLLEGNKEYKNKELVNAIYFYTEGLQVNCKDDSLNAKLYSNRATAYFYLGDYQETLNNATTAVQLEPTYIKAIERGASACFRLKCYEDAITWSEKGLAIDKNNKTLLDLRARCYGNQSKSQETKQLKKTSKPVTNIVKDQGLKAFLPETSKNVKNNTGEGTWFGDLANVLGVAYQSLGDFKKAIEYHEQHLRISQEVGDRVGEGGAYGNLGIAYRSLGNFKKALEYHERDLEIAREVEDKAREGCACGNLGVAYGSLGDFKKAIEYHERHLKIAREVGDKAGEGRSYGNLGNAYRNLGDFKKAIEFHERDLKIAQEVGDKAKEGGAYGNLGIAYDSLGDFKKAIEYHERDLKIAREVGNKAGEGGAYGCLGNAYYRLGDFTKAIEYYERCLQNALEVGDRVREASSLFNLGRSFELKGSPLEALDCYRSSVKMFNNVRHSLLSKDEWKISYRHMHEDVYTQLWRLLLQQGEAVEALFAAEQGRAQALQDLIISKFATETAHDHNTEEATFGTLSCLPANTIFMAFEEREVIFWIIQNGNVAQLKRKELADDSLKVVATRCAQSLVKNAFKKIDVRSGVKCEDRSLDSIGDEDLSKERSPPTISQQRSYETDPLRELYDVIIGPISDVIDGTELVFVPEGPLYLAPYAAFMDSDSHYLSDACKIRIIPSLTSLKLITDCPAGYHSRSGALLVGDPCLEEVLYQGRKLPQLPCAKTEVEMIGEILHIAPLTGRRATKDEVLRRLPSVALVHIAAHGSMETGEIALAPNTTRASKTPVEEDFLLTMKDVLGVQLRARLVVLSCCHSGRGEIKAEGVVGIGRAFLGAGARSVLVSLWAIEDEATLEFMKHFYRHLAEKRSASEALNRAMKCMKDSEEFNKVKYWAPFVLIGDDVTLDFGETY